MSCNKLCVQAMSNTCITTRALREQIHTRHSHCLRRHCRLIPRQQSGGLSKNTSCRIFLEDTNRSCATVRRWMSSSPLPRQGGGVVNIFDRQAKRKQKNRAALAEDAATYDYLRDEVASHVVDRVADVTRYFSAALDVGCGRGHVAKVMSGDLIGSLYQCDMAEQALLTSSSVPGDVPTHRLVADEEFLPFSNNTFDLAVSSLSLHWVNDLPKALSEVARVLKPDSPLVGAMFAGDTLFELRSALQLTELEREGGFAPHISPFVQLQDLGGLLNAAGYSLTTIDVDEVQVNYPTMFELMADLRGMGESNCAWNRPSFIKRSTLNAAAALYQEMYRREGEEGVPATFQILYFIGWKPHVSQAQPVKRGSATASLKDLSSTNTTT
ncbi:arginine-hydroxylase NDUFAF5, mitochondrial-like [Halichondria panicea]|uniref:arginine-hydroxylase NDUFAF5, mitochondrial-like n=1 Tax=Halichondria panicea TaxID=6063 RepID=UPI00312B8FC2